MPPNPNLLLRFEPRLREPIALPFDFISTTTGKQIEFVERGCGSDVGLGFGCFAVAARFAVRLSNGKKTIRLCISFFLWRRDIDFAVSAESPLLFEKQQGSGWSVFVLGRAIQPTAAAAAAATAAASRHDAAAIVPTQEFPDAATDVRPAALRRPE